MEKSYRYRVYPNKKQKELLAKTFGCCRFVYNYFLDKSITSFKQNKIYYDYYATCRELTQLKTEYEWLREPDKCALQNTLKDLGFAYKMMSKGNKFPKYKSKKTHKFSYRTQCNKPTSIQVKDKKIKLPKLGWIRYKDKQIPQGRILNATVSQVPSGKYYVSICCRIQNINVYQKTGNKIGIDVGLKEFAVMSDGQRVGNSKYMDKSLAKIISLHKSLDRKSRNGANYEKTRIKLARAYEKIAEQRRDFLQKLTTKLVKENDIICIEDLGIISMVQNNCHTVRRDILDVSWYEFKRKLNYKSEWYCKKLILVDQYFPSSQLCHCCGYKSSDMKAVSIRKWKCPVCGTTLDRDINAAINILNEGLKQIS